MIWFLTDQMRGQALSIAGDPNVRTPNLDRLARDGAWFRSACSGTPLCCPARGSWLSGQYPHRAVPGHEMQLDPALPTVADPLNEAGYYTAWFGKWHVDGYPEHEGRAAFHTIPLERRGRFQTWIGYENNNSQFDCWVHGHRGADEVPMYRLPGHETDALTDMLLDEIDARADNPFFLCCSVQPPHDPYSAPQDFAGRHNPATLELRPNVPAILSIQEQARRELSGYYALIEQIDYNVGRVLRKLEERGIDDTTYIVFASDHGDQHGSHGHFRKMTPYEESIRVPFIIWGGQRWTYRPGGTIDHPINHVDLSPTTLGLCGVEPPESMQGSDFSSVMKGPEIPGYRRPELSQLPDSAYLQCVVPTGHGPSIDEPWRGVVTSDGFKYVALEGQAMLMYDLKEDPYEQVNLAWHSHARAKRRELNETLADWIERTGDSFRLPQFDEAGRSAATRRAVDAFSTPNPKKDLQ